MTLLNTILTIILILVVIWFFKINGLTKVAHDNAETNAYNCATQGFKPDCKTPLPTSERLK